MANVQIAAETIETENEITKKREREREKNRKEKQKETRKSREEGGKIGKEGEKEEEFVYANREPRRSHFNQSSIADATNRRGGTRIPWAVALHFRQSGLIAREYATTNTRTKRSMPRRLLQPCR